MSAIQILQVGPLAPQTNLTLQERFSATALWQQADPLAWAREHGGEVRVVVTSARHGCSAELIDALPRLEAIVSFGVGYDAIALDAARARGIQVSNTPTCSTTAWPTWPSACWSTPRAASPMATASCVRSAGRRAAFR